MRGSAYYLMGEYGFAVVDLRQAVRLKPDYTEASDVLKLALEKLGPAIDNKWKSGELSLLKLNPRLSGLSLRNAGRQAISIEPKEVTVSAPKVNMPEPPSKPAIVFLAP